MSAKYFFLHSQTIFSFFFSRQSIIIHKCMTRQKTTQSNKMIKPRGKSITHFKLILYAILFFELKL